VRSLSAVVRSFAHVGKWQQNKATQRKATEKINQPANKQARDLKREESTKGVLDADGTAEMVVRDTTLHRHTHIQVRDHLCDRNLRWQLWTTNEVKRLVCCSSENKQTKKYDSQFR
jgi:hypothetical protein